jgi:hypothetical protein
VFRAIQLHFAFVYSCVCIEFDFSSTLFHRVAHVHKDETGRERERQRPSLVGAVPARHGLHDPVPLLVGRRWPPPSSSCSPAVRARTQTNHLHLLVARRSSLVARRSSPRALPCQSWHCLGDRIDEPVSSPFLKNVSCLFQSSMTFPGNVCHCSHDRALRIASALSLLLEQLTRSILTTPLLLQDRDSNDAKRPVSAADLYFEIRMVTALCMHGGLHRSASEADEGRSHGL